MRPTGSVVGRRKLLARVNGGKVSPQKFHDEVDKLRQQELDSLKKSTKTTSRGKEKKKVDLRQELINLKQRYARLEAENKELRRQVSWFEKHVKISASE